MATLDIEMFGCIIYLLINGFLIVPAYLYEYRSRNKTDPEHLVNKKSVLIAVLSSVPPSLMLTFFIISYSNYELNGHPEIWESINHGIFWALPLALYVSIFMLSRRYLFKRCK